MPATLAAVLMPTFEYDETLRSSVSTPLFGGGMPADQLAPVV